MYICEPSASAETTSTYIPFFGIPILCVSSPRAMITYAPIVLVFQAYVLNFCYCRIREYEGFPTVWAVGSVGFGFDLRPSRFPRRWSLHSLFVTTCSLTLIPILWSSRSGSVKPPTKSVDAKEMKRSREPGEKAVSNRPRLCCELLGVRPESHFVSCRKASFP